MRTHTGEKPYSCTWPGCDASFSQAPHLTAHMQMHTNSKPHVCNWPGCKAAYCSKSPLTEHMSVHTKEKPLRCTWPGCEASFSFQTYMKVHKRIHMGERSYKCSWPGCQAAFTQVGHLKGHKQKWHSEGALVRQKREEVYVAAWLDARRISYEPNQRIKVGRVYREVDFIIYTPDGTIHLEVGGPL